MASPETIEFHQKRWAILDRSPFLKAFLDPRMPEDDALWITAFEEFGRPLSKKVRQVSNNYGFLTIKPLAMNGDLHQIFSEGLDPDDKMGFVTTIFFIGFEVGDLEDSCLFIDDLSSRLILNGAINPSQNTKAAILSWLAAGILYRNLLDSQSEEVAVSPELREAINGIPALDFLGN